MHVRLKNPGPYQSHDVRRTSKRFVEFEAAKKCIIDPRTRCLTLDDPARETAVLHFRDMFEGGRADAYGKETGTIVMPYARLGGGPSVVTIADYTATAGVGNMLNVVEVRARAFSNVMDAYFVYLTALAKTVVPVKLPHVAPSTVPEAPELPNGFGWADVTAAAENAKRQMIKAGRDIFGINPGLHPERSADYLETVSAWAAVSLELRGAWDYFDGLNMVTTWTEGTGKAAEKCVAKAFVAPVEFMDEFVRADTKIQEANVAERKELMYAAQDQHKARRARLRVEPRLSQRWGGTKPLTAEQTQMFAGTRSMFRGASTETAAAPRETALPTVEANELDELFGLTAERQTASAAASRVSEPGGGFSSAPEGESSLDLIDSMFMKLNNPRGPLRRGTSSKMRYPRGR